MKYYCECPVTFSAKRTLKNGKVLYAKSYGLRCWPITTHNENCPHKRDRQLSLLEP